jgi:hypothetical protein
MESQDNIHSVENHPIKRPNFLTVLCILSFVYIGFSLFFSFLSLINGPMSEEQLLEQKVELSKSVDEMRSLEMESLAVLMEKITRMSEALNERFYESSLLSIAVFFIGLIGVLFLWKSRKVGIHLYIIYSLLSVLEVYFFVNPQDIPTVVIIWNFLFSGLFVFLYSRNFKSLH